METIRTLLRCARGEDPLAFQLSQPCDTDPDTLSVALLRDLLCQHPALRRSDFSARSATVQKTGSYSLLRYQTNTLTLLIACQFGQSTAYYRLTDRY